MGSSFSWQDESRPRYRYSDTVMYEVHVKGFTMRHPDIPPELREHTGEIEAAEHHRLPDLVTLADLRGVFHCHTTWSDGRDSLEAMAEAAKRKGLKYLGIADHSQSLTVARGLSPERVRQQQQEIDALNQQLKGITLFKGIECDILAYSVDRRWLATSGPTGPGPYS